jgi:hypothetical protein
MPLRTIAALQLAETTRALVVPSPAPGTTNETALYPATHLHESAT